MTGAGRQLAISHGPQLPAQCLRGDDDAEFLEDPLAEVDDPPAPTPCTAGALEYRGERGAVRAVQTRRLSGRLAINQPFRLMGVELHHPNRERSGASPRRSSPPRSGSRLQIAASARSRPGLRPILDRFAAGLNHPRIKISPKWNGHGEPPVLATLDQTHADSGSPSESRLLSFGMEAVHREAQDALVRLAQLLNPHARARPRPRSRAA